MREKLVRTDDARTLLRDLFRSEADLVPDMEQGVLRVHVHPMSNPWSNRAIAHLLEHLNAAEFPYPGTNLRLVYSIAGEAETPNLAPHQNPADQEVWGSTSPHRRNGPSPKESLERMLAILDRPE